MLNFLTVGQKMCGCATLVSHSNKRKVFCMSSARNLLERHQKCAAMNMQFRKLEIPSVALSIVVYCKEYDQ